MTSKYRKPSIETIEIPERTAYACNISNNIPGCPHISQIANQLLCSPSNYAKFGLTQCS
jgi:hypothetical protein